MRALIVYESLWGNTEEIARAVATGLALTMSVDVVTSDAAPADVDRYDLLIVGGPTHAFSMSRATTRKSAVEERGAKTLPTRGIREWIERLESTASTVAYTFDTRVDSPRLPGSAAKAARHELRSRGFSTPAKAVSFYVHGYEGPLVDGEVDRATAWGQSIAAATAPRAAL
jgi:flavodoxin